MNPVLNFITAFRWQDMLDILLISYILFRLYALFRGTNVIRVIAGIALLWGFQRLAAGLGLIVTSWALQGIVAGAALIIIIIFRNEIRNVLQAKNIGAILWGVSHKKERTPIQDIVEGVYEMARRRIGALIVMVGGDSLDEIVQGGVDWQGKISREMLMSVFWSGNPVHDGAAVVQQGRITKVGVILPLSNRKDLPPYYGTRHRAAAGLSEQSDALIIVVSEERGEVVAAKQGTFVPLRNASDLRRLLDEHSGDTNLQNAAVHNQARRLVLASLVSVFCAGAVWFSFAKGTETLTSIEVPLEYMNRESSMQIQSSSVNTVRLHLSGSSILLSRLRPDQVKVKLDLGQASQGNNNFTLKNFDIELPPGVRLNRIEPALVTVILDVPAKKEVPIQADWVGSLPEGLILRSATIVPTRTTLVGPQGELEGINTVYTEKIPLGTLEESGSIKARLALESSMLRVAEGFAELVEVHYVIARRQE